MPDFNNKMHQIEIGSGSSRRSPRLPSRMGRGHTLPILHPLGTFDASILAPSALDLCAVKNFPYFKPWYMKVNWHRPAVCTCLWWLGLSTGARVSWPPVTDDAAPAPPATSDDNSLVTVNHSNVSANQPVLKLTEHASWFVANGLHFLVLDWVCHPLRISCVL